MVQEEEEEEESLVFVPAVEHRRESTLGAALDALEARVKKAGVNLSLEPPSYKKGMEAKKSSNNLVSGKVIRCPMLVKLAISQAIEYETNPECSASNVAYECAWENAIVPGNVVAFRSQTQFSYSFLECSGLNADFKSSKKSVSLHCARAMFLVVKGVLPGTVALWNIIEQRFLCFSPDNKGLCLSNTRTTLLDDSPRIDETLTIRKCFYDDAVTIGGSTNRKPLAFFLTVHQIAGLA